MKTWKAVFLAVVLVSTLVAVVGANAQSTERGEIRGFVYDTSHAVVPNAKVTISNSSTGYKREQVTEATGTYDFASLLPGVYQIAAEAQGFASITITDINVNIGSSQALDITLPVKGQTQTIMVSAAATGPVDTTTAGINQVINQRNLENLPLEGRDYRDLAILSSSAQVVPGLRGGIRLGGQQSDYTSLVIDGQDSFNNYFGEFLGSLETKNFTIPLESVQEFQVVTNGFAPEFGRATGGLINVITKSGTNQLHGEAHEYYRGSSLTSNDGVGNPPNISNQNQFGGSVGFPIHKDRQFLFLATEVQRENGPLVTQFCPSGTGQAECVAALATATGPTFSTVPCTGPIALGGNCALGTVPTFTANTTTVGVPTGCHPVAGDLVLKDCYGVTSLLGFNGSGNQLQNLFTILGHYDYQFSPANHFSFRSYYTKNHTNGFSGGVGQNEIPMAFDDTENFINKGGAGTFSLNTVLGRKVNEIRVSIQDEVRERHPNSMSPMVAISPGPGDPADLVVGSGFNYGFGQRYFLPINNQDGKFEASDSFDYIFGKHDIKFGGNVVTFEDRKDSFVGWGAGEYDFGSLKSFNNGVPELLNQGVALNGLPLTFLGPATTLFPNYQTGLGLYLQDKWQISPNITLTYGLRYDATWNPQPQTPLVGTCAYVGVGAPAGNSCASMGGSGSTVARVPQRYPADLNQFGPRIGLAWNVRSGDHPTLVRAAWGLYYAASIVGIFTPTAGSGNLAHCLAICGFPNGGTTAFPYTAPTSTTLSASELVCPPAKANSFGCPSYGSQGDYIDPNIQNPRILSLTGGVEQTLARDLTLTITYSYVHSTHLRTGGYPTEEAWARNFIRCGGAGQPPATDAFGRSRLCGLLDPSVAAIGSGAGDTASFSHGNYNSIVVNITKRFSHHFQVFANYTWSQNKDNASSERDTDTFFGTQDPFNIGMDYGRNGLDIRNQFRAAGVYELPWGFAVSSTVLARTGVPFPIYINVDVNGDGVSNSGHNNDRPTITIGGKTSLLGRYPLNQPGFFEWDSRLQKDIGIHERYHVILSADFFNMTNRANLYSNPNTGDSATIDYTKNCTPWSGPGGLFPLSTALGFSCTPLTSLPTVGADGLPLRRITQVAPGSTPFAFQAGVKFQF